MKTGHKRKKYRKCKYVLFCIILFFCFLIFLDLRFAPLLKEISHIQCKNQVNTIINDAITTYLSDLNTDNLLIKNENTYTANTVVINQFCTDISIHITDQLQQYPPEKISIPAGAATGLAFLADKGPCISFTLHPMSAVKTDYETAFLSTGINQINYKIWLNLSMEMKIVNPLYQETVHMQRKIMLSDLVFSGKVPEYYFQMNSPDEYLLTE